GRRREELEIIYTKRRSGIKCHIMIYSTVS
ncbi:hypothetical protein C5S39_15070, partial [Candidatus Methanophagaceae archaeon]